MGVIHPVILRVIAPVIGNPFGLPIYGGVLVPPVSDELLIWLKGNSDDTEKLDSWKRTDAEDFTMSQSNCITLDGTNEYGTLDTATTLVGDCSITCGVNLNVDVDSAITGTVDGKCGLKFRDVDRLYVHVNSLTQVVITASPPFPLTEFEFKFERVGTVGSIYVDGVLVGSNTIAVDDFIVELVGSYKTTQNMDGKFYDLTLQDNTQDIHYRIAEGNDSEFSWDDTGTNFITWTGVIADMWAGRQDSYHGNAVGGWWEKAADATMYPYAVAGFSEFHKGGTWNDCETSYAPEETPLGTSDGTEEILLPFDVPADGAITYDGTCTATLDISNNKITMTAGTIRNIEVTGTLTSTGLEMTDDLEMTDNLEMV